MSDTQQFRRPLIHSSGLTMNISGEQLVLKQPLALGGISEVWSASYLEKTVAAKLINPPPGSRPESVKHASERMIRGAKLQMQYRGHRSFVACEAYAFGKGRPHIAVYELQEQPTLIERFNRQRRVPGPRRAALLMCRLCDVVEVMHRKQHLHLDLKSDNFFLDDKWNPILSDFDFVQTFEEGEKHERWLEGGCPLHAAPERWLRTEALCPQTDVYSLGIMYWYMLTLDYPFRGKDLRHTGLAHCKAELPIEKLVERKVPQAIIEVLVKTLAKNLKDRFATAGELKSALKDALEKNA
jgi:serine/threonine-protein kinase